MSDMRRISAAVVSVGALLLTMPQSVFAHTIIERYQAPLPLIVYVAGAGLAVAMSFVFVILRSAPPSDERRADAPARRMPAWLRLLLQGLGLIGWLWIVAQTVFGGSGSGDVASLFVWVYGWVGVALVSALLGPAWAWIDPFSTLHRLLTAAGARLGLSGGEAADYPARLGRWPAAAGFAALVWIELVGRVEGGRPLGLLVIAYTFLTLAAMSYFGRETWRRNGEIFSVWFGLLGRLAPYALVGEPEDGRIRRRPFGAGLLSGGWSNAQLVIIALATGAIIYDGLSQTQIYFELFGSSGLPPVLRDTLVGGVFLGGLVSIVLLVARRLNVAALCAGLLPVALGYLIAHYLSYLLVDGQRIIAALNDPLLRGDNFLPFDLGFYEPKPFLPSAVLWSIQLAAVVGGHVVGAWAGHAALAGNGERPVDRKRAQQAGRADALRQLPLAVLMVGLTSLTLWSLGQAVLSPANT